MPGQPLFEEKRFPRFDDRRSAGRMLAKALARYARGPGAIVLGLPRGGVVTADEVAHELGLPLDVLVVGKLRAPGREELTLGAIGPGGVRSIHHAAIAALRIAPWQIAALAEQETKELERRERLYRGSSAPLDLAGQTVILVDDGVATGSTMQAALEVVRGARAAQVVVAVPVGPADTCAELRRNADDLVSLATPVTV
ncbi:MAG TPA: phosphoribosyltransferase family protein [Thermoanaerobaculia bacterium]|nr:phosphoribosyltransferase family protein [Thermoanaerobaculia bacterium]